MNCIPDKRGWLEPAVHGAEVDVQGLPPGAVFRDRVTGTWSYDPLTKLQSWTKQFTMSGKRLGEFSVSRFTKRSHSQSKNPPPTLMFHAFFPRLLLQSHNLLGRDMLGQRRRVVQETVRRRGHPPRGDGIPRVFLFGAAAYAAPAKLPQGI